MSSGVSSRSGRPGEQGEPALHGAGPARSQVLGLQGGSAGLLRAAPLGDVDHHADQLRR